MHEFSICQGIISQVRKALPINANDIVEVKVMIGELAGIDIESLKFWFPVVAKKVNMPKLSLDVEVVTSKVKCNCCEHIFRLVTLYQECPRCKQYANFEFINGKELVLKSIKY